MDRKDHEWTETPVSRVIPERASWQCSVCRLTVEIEKGKRPLPAICPQTRDLTREVVAKMLALTGNKIFFGLGLSWQETIGGYVRSYGDCNSFMVAPPAKVAVSTGGTFVVWRDDEIVTVSTRFIDLVRVPRHPEEKTGWVVVNLQP